MKLAEAESRLEEITSKMNDIKLRVKKISLQEISGMLQSFSSLTSEYRDLNKSISSVKSKSLIMGTSVKELEETLLAIECQIDVFRSISIREDVPAPVLSMIFNQLDSFVAAKNQIEKVLEKTSWELDLI